MAKVRFKKNDELYKKSAEDIIKSIEKIITEGLEKVITETFSSSAVSSNLGLLLQDNILSPAVDWNRIKEEVFVKPKKSTKKKTKRIKK